MPIDIFIAFLTLVAWLCFFRVNFSPLSENSHLLRRSAYIEYVGADKGILTVDTKFTLSNFVALWYYTT